MMADALPAQVDRARSILEALDSDKRLRMLAALYNEGDRLSFRELGERTGITGPSLAQHLKPLVQTGLVLNAYHPTDGREYSFYEISPLGRDWLIKAELVDDSTDTAYLIPA